ncbi:MAG: sigma 54-interacting transcriptional regulator [Candidatus Sulfotelmatobacter sp.]|jgi:formate hydrogenlyase transcriptional activator
MIAGEVCLTDVLENLCREIDAQSPDVMSSVMLMDPDGKRLWPIAGQRLPKEWISAITPLPIGPRMGSCGTAAFRKQRIVNPDIASDPLWSGSPAEEYREIALRSGLRAAWSQPVISKSDELLGTFAMYYGAPRSPSAADLQLIEGAGHIALIATETERSRTLLKKAFDELKKSKAQLETILNTIPTVAWRGEPDGSINYFNRRWHEYTGLSPEESHGWGWTVIIHPEDKQRAMDQWLLQVLPSRKAAEIVARLRRFDGEYRWFMVRVEPFFDESGNVIHWYGAETDIEDLKQAQVKLRQDEQELRRMTDAIPHAIVVQRPDGTALYANQIMLEYTGLTLEDVQADGSRERIFHPHDLERVRDERQKALAIGEPFEIEQRARRNDGQYRWFLIRYNPLRDDSGHVIRWYATGTDIEDRKQAEEKMRNENLALREVIADSSMFDEIVGSSESLRRVLSQVAKVARTDSTVLILGETGTGKELIASAIHKRSNRSSRAFIRVNCAAIPSSLIASELFGHEKGAFTGALQRRLGRFEAAAGGTIFLDEIGDLPGETQLALLRVLQEREFERIGSNQPISVDVRVVAATHRDLKAAVSAGTFRADLFYRLNVFPIEIPSLRDRVDDIPLLVEYLIERYAKKAGKKIRHIKKKTLELFQRYDWPGNIRELQNVIERAVILCDGEEFAVDESWLKPESTRPSGPTDPSPSMLAEGQRALAQREREMIEAALVACKGRVSGPSGAAARLAIPRQTLDSRIKALQINKHRFKTP